MSEPTTLHSVESFLSGDVVESSRDRGWRGIEVMRARIARDELTIEGLRTHTLAMNVGAPFVIDANIEGRRVAGHIGPHSLMLIEAGVHSEWHWRDAELDMLHVSLDDDALRSYADELALPSRPEIITRVGFSDDGLVRLGAAFARELARPAGGQLAAQGLRVAFTLQLLERYSSVREHAALRRPVKSLGTRTLRRLDDYIAAHLGADVGLDDLARLTGLSRFHFARAFRATVGLPPYRYIVSRRLERAMTLLLSSTDLVSDIASATGFADQSHLTRAIKLRYGVTPAALRRAR